MLQRLTTLAGVWFVLLATAMALSASLGVHSGISSGLVLAAVTFVPPLIISFVWKDSAPLTVAEVLHEVEHSSK